MPINSNADDLIDKLIWLRRHPSEAVAIGRAGRELALSITYDGAIDQAKSTVARLVAMNGRLHGKE